MTNIKTDVLAELGRLEKEATPGPWTVMETLEIYAFHDKTGLDRNPHSTPIAEGYLGDRVPEQTSLTNAVFIALTRNALPALLAIAKAARILKQASDAGQPVLVPHYLRAALRSLDEVKL